MDKVFNFTGLFDSHCHLNDAKYDGDRDEVVHRALENGVEQIIDVGVDWDSSQKAIANAQRFPGVVFASVGVDPEILIPGSDSFEQLAAQAPADEGQLAQLQLNFLNAKLQLEEIKVLVSGYRSSVVCIGETGLDSYWLSQGVEKTKNVKQKTRNLLAPEVAELSLKLQEELFELHLEMAMEFALPLSVHSRGAEERSVEVVRRFPDARGIFHSYTGDYATAKQILDLGWGLGCNGIATFPNANELRDVYKRVLGEVSSADWSPEDFYSKGVYFETDAPYLAPEGKRGERNEPGNVRDIFEFLSESLA